MSLGDCASLSDLLEEAVWPSGVEPSGFQDPEEVVPTPSGFQNPEEAFVPSGFQNPEEGVPVPSGYPFAPDEGEFDISFSLEFN